MYQGCSDEKNLEAQLKESKQELEGTKDEHKG